MAEYPVVGRDRNIWGDKLREWDFVSHNPDGTLKDSVVTDIRSGLATDGDVTNLQNAVDALNLRPVTTKTANYTATTDDYTIRVDATAGPVTITLPATVVGDVFEIEKIDASANDVIVDGNGSDVINIPGTGPALTATLESQFALLIIKCTVANQWTWISAVGNVT